MTLLFTDGFDHYSNAISYGYSKEDADMKYFATPHIASYGAGPAKDKDTDTSFQEGISKTSKGSLCRWSKFVEGIPWYFQVDIEDSNIVIAGISFYMGPRTPDSSSGETFLAAFNNSIYVNLNSDYTLSVYSESGDTLLGTTEAPINQSHHLSTNKLATPIWYSLELKVVVSQTVGEVELRMNGVPWLHVTGVDTDIHGSGLTDSFLFACPRFDLYVVFDDLYILNDQGSDFNDFLGEINITTLIVNGQGAYQQLSQEDDFAFSRENYYLVWDRYSVDLNNYTYGSGGAKDTYTLGDITPNLTGNTKLPILGVIINAVMLGVGYPIIRINSTDYPQAAWEWPDGETDYVVLQSFVAENPDTSLPWTAADLDSVEIGVEPI
jgi:hypothetical protein